MANDIGFEQAVQDRILDMTDAMVDAAGGLMGMPPGGKRYTPTEQAEMWNASPIADPEQRARQMLQLYQQGVPIGDITDQIYPNRRKLIETGRPNLPEQQKFSDQMERQMARLARDSGHHIPGVEPWGTITAENAPQEAAEGTTMSSMSAPMSSMSAPMSAFQQPDMPPPDSAAGAPTPGWAEPGGQFGLTGVMS